MKTRLLPFLLFVTIVLSSCTESVTGPVFLQGNITGEPGDVVVLSYLPNQSIGYHYPEVTDGVFEFSLDGVENFTDLVVSVGGVEFGAPRPSDENIESVIESAIKK